MGEYGVRKSDGLRIKIGTCESNYYVRYEDKGKVKPDQGSEFGCFWRIPLPSEDGIEPGDYKSHVCTQRLWKVVSREIRKDREGNEVIDQRTADFSDSETVDYPGSIQLKHECGLLMSVPCYHGEKLPETPEGFRIGWNGKSWFYELRFLKTQGSKVFPVVHCRACGNMWRYEWADVLPYLHGELRKRLEKYAK